MNNHLYLKCQSNHKPLVDSVIGEGINFVTQVESLSSNGAVISFEMREGA